MANIQTLFVIKAENGSIVNAETSFDLSTIVSGLEVPKEVTGIYIVQNGTTFTEYTSPVSGAKYVTKVTNQATGDVAYIDAPPGGVSDLLTNPSCPQCQSSAGSATIVSSCDNPVFVKICDPTGKDRELVFTDSEPICVTSNGVSTPYLVRERIVWDSINYVEISRQTEYSADGLSWSTTQPSGTIVLGSCGGPVVSSDDCELIITAPVPYCVKFSSTSTSDDCCTIDTTVYQQWFIREKIVWNSVTCTEVSKVTEYSDDGINWTTSKPTGGKLGECPVESPQKCGCCPAISEAFGDDLSTLSPSHNFVITKPSCCKIKVTTSIGSFHVLDSVQVYSTSDFDCVYEITDVEVISGSCTLDKVQIIGNKLK